MADLRALIASNAELQAFYHLQAMYANKNGRARLEMKGRCKNETKGGMVRPQAQRGGRA
jgi:hypothetical protein